jgi:hypothetical protein
LRHCAGYHWNGDEGRRLRSDRRTYRKPSNNGCSQEILSHDWDPTLRKEKEERTLESSFGFLQGAWPFGLMEAGLAVVALRQQSRCAVPGLQ